MTGSTRTARVLLLGFFLSGLTGLLYQSLWIRMLTLVMGGTTAALTTVLIAFMGGLALGSALFGRMADRAGSLVRTYAALEVAIGLWALGLPWVYDAVPALYRTLHGLDPAHGVMFNLTRFFLALLFFGLPATWMGGTLPLVIQALRRYRPDLQEAVASAYAINTFGATVGAFLAGFVVIPTLGLSHTLFLTGVLNILLGAFFYRWMGRHEQTLAGQPELPDPVRSSAATAPADESERVASSHLPWLLLLLFFFMGASSLSYELLWHRLLALSFGSSVYAVSTMLTAFLLGIGLGSWLWRREQAPARVSMLGWLEVGIALSAAFTTLALAWLPYGVQFLYLLPYLGQQVLGAAGSDLGFWLLQGGLFLLGVLCMGLPTGLMGASFPLAVRLYAENVRGAAAGSSIGRVYAANTVGSIVGLALTGFVLIEAFGTDRVSRGFVVLNGLLGLLLLRAGRAPRGSLVAAILGVVAVLGLPGPSRSTLISGVYYHPLGAQEGVPEALIRHTQEDDQGLVSIHETREWDQPGAVHVLKFNGKFMGAEGARLPVLQQFAHLPLLMHGPEARIGLVIGLGGGFTAEAALKHPLERLDAVEISAGVIEAARKLRPAIFQDPRLKLIHEDARSLLLTTSARYDVIISETSDPWMTGVSNLYTLEFFRWVKDALAPGGVFGTWLQVRHKRIEDVRTLFATMQAVFPHMAVAELAEGDVMLLMSNQPLRLDAQFLRQSWTRMTQALEAAHLRTPWSLPAKLVLDASALRHYVEGAPLNTDDLPRIEFSTPRSLNIGLLGENVRADLRAAAPDRLEIPLLNAQPGDTLQWQVARALALNAPQRARQLLLSSPEAAQLPPGERTYLLAVAAFRQGLALLPKPPLDLATPPTLPAEARAFFQEALTLSAEEEPSPRLRLLQAGCHLYLGDLVMLERHLTESIDGIEASWRQRGMKELPPLEARVSLRLIMLGKSLGID